MMGAKTAVENDQDKLLTISNALFDTFSNYFKAMKNEGSWIHYYISNLRIKPPPFSFTESKQVFEQKLFLLLDIMDLAHLYCKVMNPKDYSSQNHTLHKNIQTYLTKSVSELTQEQFFEIRNHLKSSVMFGAN